MFSHFKINLAVLILILLYSNILGASIYNKDTLYINQKSLDIKGNILANGNPIDTGFVILYSINNPSGSCFAIDTVFVGNDGKYSFSNFQSDYTNFILKACLHTLSIYYNEYLPTYYNTKFTWVNALPVVPTNNGSSYNINLMPASAYAFGGNSSIEGNISNSFSEPLSNVEVLLINSFNNSPIQKTFTDEQGNYIFNNLPFNVYGIYVEMSCKISNRTNVTLNYMNPVVNGINFILNQNNVLNLEEKIKSPDEFQTYPNPFSNILNIEFELKNNDIVRFLLLDNYGRLIIEKTEICFSGINKSQVETHFLSSGIYILHIITKRNTIVTKKIIKNY